MRFVSASHFSPMPHHSGSRQFLPTRATWRLGTTVLLVCGFSAPIWAQSTTGSVFGTVTDQSGGVVPQATITITSVGTGISRTAHTNASGNYVFQSVTTGDYKVSTTASGFGAQTQSGIHVDANQNANASFKLNVGSENQNVTVTTSQTLVDTRESQIGETISRKRVEDLPLNGRDVSSLVQLVPGVTAYSGQQAGGNQYGTTFSVNGSRTNEDSFYLDGAFDTSLFITGGDLLPNPDAVQEFRLLTNNFDAEFGRFPGGVVNVITRSGTNAFHGSAYDYLRNNVLNSRNYFNTTITPLKQNQFGGTLGGPILRDKAFFFGSYEGLRIVTPFIVSPTSLVTPTPAEARGDFSALSPAQQPKLNGVPYSYNGRPGVIDPALLDPVAQRLLQQVPLADPVTGLTPQQSASANTTANQYLLHFDYQAAADHQISGVLFQSFSTALTPGQGGNQIVSYSGGQSTVNQTNVVLSDVWTLSPTKLNTFRPFYTLNHTNLTNLYTGNVGWAYYGSQIGIGAFPLTQPQVSINGYWTMGLGSGGPDDLHQQTFGAEDVFDWNKGNNAIKLGGSFFWNRYAEQGEYLGTGQATFTGFVTGNALADFLLGRANTLRQNNGASHSLTNPAPSLFAQDDWRITRKLTLDLGLRWEYFTPYKGQNNFGTFVPNVQSRRFPNAPLGLLTAGDPGVPDGITKTQLTAFAPRVGFAYDVFGDGRTAFRGGYGIFYAARAVSLTTNPEQQPFILDNTISNLPNLVQPYGSAAADPFPYTVNLQNPTFFSGGTLSSVPLGATAPYEQEYNLTVEQQLGKNWALRMAYVGSLSRKFYLSRDRNEPVYAPGASTATAALNARRPYQPNPGSYVFGSIVENDPANNATYNALQVTVTHRFAYGFSILANYVWSKSIDISSNDPSNITLTLSDQNNIGADRGRSNYDVPQRFVVSYLWSTPSVRRYGLLGSELLGDWQLNGITTISTGQPFNVTSGVDSNLDSVLTDRPNTVGDPNLDGSRSREAKIREFFNTAAFAPVPGNSLNPYGNTRRNSFIGPGIVNTDFSVFKDLPVWRESILQVRGEAFNLFNTVNLSNPTSVQTSPLFGTISNSAPARVVQVALKYLF